MNLDNFEAYIDKKILSRGESYYEEGYIDEVKKVDGYIYKAKVQGTDVYTVEVELDSQNNIIGTLCDCPYDLGEYCKHQAAVLFYLRDKLDSNVLVDLSDNVCQINHPRTASKTDNAEPDIKNLLSESSKNELIDFLILLAEEEEVIRERIILHFSQTSEEEDIKNAKEIIKSYIHLYSDRGGYIDYRDVNDSIKGAEIVLDKIKSVIQQGRLLHATNLTLCVLRIMIDLIQDADDSDGFIGGVISSCYDYLGEIVGCKEISQEQKEKISEEMLKEAAHKRFDGWTDWRYDLVELCSKLADTPVIRKKVENYLAKKIEDENDAWSQNYLKERIALIRLNMIQQNDGSAAAHAFIYENLKIPALRRLAIMDAMNKKEYDQVIKLTLFDENKESGFPGRISQWKEFRYEAYCQSGMLAEQRNLAKEFVLNGSFEYYLKLKNTYTGSEWKTIYPGIINDLEKQKGYFYKDNYTRILIEEGENRKLLNYVKNNPSSVEIFYKYLIREYRDSVYEIFIQYIEKSAAEANNRKQYQKVCSIIKNLKKAGGKEEANMIKARLFNKYANRPALRDELSRV
jgi:hypothetical protein